MEEFLVYPPPFPPVPQHPLSPFGLDSTYKSELPAMASATIMTFQSQEERRRYGLSLPSPEPGEGEKVLEALGKCTAPEGHQHHFSWCALYILHRTREGVSCGLTICCYCCHQQKMGQEDWGIKGLGG